MSHEQAYLFGAIVSIITAAAIIIDQLWRGRKQRGMRRQARAYRGRA